MRSWFAALNSLLFAVVAVPAVAQERPWEWGWAMHHPGWWMWGAGGLVMMLMMLAFWAVVITGVVLGIRWLTRQGREELSDRALDILRERYARGEIDKEEFDAKRRDLGRPA